MRRRLARYFVATACATSGFGGHAAPPACRSDADCAPPTPLCQSFSLSRPPQRLCIPPIPATARSTNGADAAERAQEQRIATMLVALSGGVDALQPGTLSELREVLEREVRAGGLDETTFKREMSQAHAALLQLDRYERLVLLRYLKRQFSTEFERWLFIILDVIRHPDLVPSTEVAALDIRINAELLRLQGTVSDRASQCARLAVIVQLKRQKWAAVLALETRRIEASNVSPERREALIENARRWTRHVEQSESAILLGDCGGNASLPGPVAVPPMPAAARSAERPRYTLYSLDSPEMVVLADAAAIPPVESGAWDRSQAGKRFAQRRATSEQAKSTSEAQRPFFQDADRKLAEALRSADSELKASIGSCSTDEACEAATKAVLKNFEARVSSAGDRMEAAPVGNAPVTKRPSYAGLQPYDADGQSLNRRFANTGFFRWIFNMMAENLAVEAIHHYAHVKLDPLPPSMVNKLHVAEQLAKFPDAKTPCELAGWGAALHKELVVPFAPNIGERIHVMTQSVMQLKDPPDPDFTCPKK